MLIIGLQQIYEIRIYSDSNSEGTILERKTNLVWRTKTFNDIEQYILSNAWSDAKCDLDNELLPICALLALDWLCNIFAVQPCYCQHWPNMIRVIICSHQTLVFTAIRSLRTLHNRVMMFFLYNFSNRCIVQHLSGRTSTVQRNSAISSVDSNDIYVCHKESSSMIINIYWY